MPSDDFFDVNTSIMKFGGIWIPVEKIGKFKTAGCIAWNAFWIIYSAVIFTPSEIYSLPFAARNLNDLIKNMNMALTHVLAVSKMIVWFYYRNVILDIVQTLRANVQGYDEHGDFRPWKIVEDDKRINDRVIKVFITFAAGTGTSAAVQSYCTLLGDYKEQYLEVVEGNSSRVIYNQKLPFFSYMPWDYTSSRLSFGVAILYQCIPVFNFAFIIIGFDTLYTSIICYIGSQFSIIQGDFRTIRARCLKKLNLPEQPTLHDSHLLSLELKKELNKNIKALQVLFTICSKIESIFTVVILSQVMISLMVLCTCLYLVSSVPIASQKFFVESVYLIAIEIQLFTYCYFGNKVTERGEGVPLALYECDWFSTEKSFKTSMIITMQRMQRPIYFTIGKFSPLTLTTFVTIGRGSYSFFAVLKNSN